MDDNKRKKIVILQQYFYPDISAVSQLLGDLLVYTTENSAIEVTVLCSTTATTADKSKNHVETIGSISIKRIPTLSMGKKTFLHRLVGSLNFYFGVFAYLLFSRRYDLAVSMTTPPLVGFVAAIATWIRRKPLVYYIQDLYPEMLFDLGYIRRIWILKKLKGFNSFICRKAKRIITIGSYMTAKLLSNYQVDRDKITEIPNWTNMVAFKAPKIHENFILQYSGNLGLAHDFGLLSDLIRELKNEKVFYDFVGGGKKFQDVNRIFTESGERRFKFRGYVERGLHGTILSNANMFIIAQREETVGDILPSKLYSCLAAGRPILFMGPGNSEIGQLVIRNAIGCVIEIEEDIYSAVMYIMNMKSNTEFYKKECKRISDLYKKNYGPQISGEKFIQVLNKAFDNEK
jgi:glycosyltransferase involved in cell wall biosynthesis